MPRAAANYRPDISLTPNDETPTAAGVDAKFCPRDVKAFCK